MGALYGVKCYATNAEAADAFFLAMPPAITSGATSYLSWFEKNVSTWQIKRQSIASNGTVTTLTASTATVPTFPTCDQSTDFLDGVTIGWGVVLAMVISWSYRLMQRATK